MSSDDERFIDSQVQESEMMIKVGFTGSQEGMTLEALNTLKYLLEQLEEFELHHGDCEGSDFIAHRAALKLNARIIIHPPSKTNKRAFSHGATVTLDPRPYLDRNKDIVDSTEVLFATPLGPEKLRSGTWSTIRYAKKRGKKIILIKPDGAFEER